MDLTNIVKNKISSLGVSLDSSFLVAVSGGADSTALLLAMHGVVERAEGLTCAHLDHGLRQGSMEDAQYVKDLCRDLGVRTVVGRLEPDELEAVRREHGSLEAAMRVLRYRFLYDAAERSGSEWILTGHTADDQSETVLFRAARGMDWRSLGAIPARRGKVLRPLLGLTRSAVIDFCREMDIKPLTDPSNYDEAYTRNRIRHTVLPALSADLGINISGLLCRTGTVARQLASVEANLLEQFVPDHGIGSTRSFKRAQLTALPDILQNRYISDYLYRVLNSFPSLKLIENVLAFVETGKNGSLTLPGGLILVLSYGEVCIRTDHGPTEPALPETGIELTVPGRLVLESANMVITAALHVLEEPGEYPAGDTVLLSGKSFTGPLWVRKRLPGDHFTPLGHKSKIKLKEFLVNRKLPREIRDRIPVVTGDDGEILWVGGVEISQRAAMKGVKGEKGVLLRIEHMSKVESCSRDHDSGEKKGKQ